MRSANANHWVAEQRALQAREAIDRLGCASAGSHRLAAEAVQREALARKDIDALLNAIVIKKSGARRKSARAQSPCPPAPVATTIEPPRGDLALAD